jgi:hypothetical protein
LWHSGYSGAPDLPQRGQCDCADYDHSMNGESHVHRPVGATVFTELPGAIEWVDDPHPFGVYPGRISDAFLRQDRIAWASLPKPIDQEIVGSAITLRAEEIGILGS